MRAYAMLLGLALTGTYAYAAHVAVASVGSRRAEAAAPATFVETPVWYGGVLDPVTVRARGDSPEKTAAARRLLLDQVPARCSHASPAHRAAV